MGALGLNRIAANDKADVFFTRSTNRGTNWTSPLRVNTDSTTNDQWMPVLAVKPDGTQLFMAWYDRRGDTNNSLMQERCSATQTKATTIRSTLQAESICIGTIQNGRPTPWKSHSVRATRVMSASTTELGLKPMMFSWLGRTTSSCRKEPSPEETKAMSGL